MRCRESIPVVSFAPCYISWVLFMNVGDKALAPHHRRFITSRLRSRRDPRPPKFSKTGSRPLMFWCLWNGAEKRDSLVMEGVGEEVLASFRKYLCKGPGKSVPSG